MRQSLPPVKQVNNLSTFENDRVPLFGPVWARAVGWESPHPLRTADPVLVATSLIFAAVMLP